MWGKNIKIIVKIYFLQIQCRYLLIKYSLKRFLKKLTICDVDVMLDAFISIYFWES